MFTHLDTINPVEINTIESDSGRFYVTPEGKHYPSITTILGWGPKPWLDEWREGMGAEAADAEMKRAADRGTAVHDMAEKYLKNVPEPTEGHSILHIPSYMQLRLKLNKVNNILTQETPLWSNTMRVAGRVDCVGEFNKQRCIIDFKTSTNDKDTRMVQDYFLQTTAYALMFHERYGIQIDHVAILMSVEKGAVPLIFTSPIDPYIEPLLDRINKYHKAHEVIQ